MAAHSDDNEFPDDQFPDIDFFDASDDDQDQFSDTAAPAADDTVAPAGPPPARLRAQASAPTLRPVWEFLTADQETEQLAHLGQWVMWLVHRHEVGAKVRPCWSLHGPALEALTALFQRWMEIYLAEGWGGDFDGAVAATGNKGYEAVVWHEQLDTRVGRLGAGTFAGCGVTHRGVDPDEDWAGPSLYLGQIARTQAPPVTG